MNRHITNILQKEWRVIFQDLNNILFVTVLPLIIVAEPLVMIWLINRFGSDALLGSSLIQSALRQIMHEIPILGVYSSMGVPFEVLLLSQFKFFLLLIPTMIAISFATFSIIDEKQSRSLEPLLATPVKTWEVLLGKALAGAIPAVLVTWVCAGVFFLGVALMGWGGLIKLVLTPSWYITFFLLTPAVAVLSFLLGVVGSSRAKDAKNAQNMIILIVLPVLALIALQVTGVVWFTPFMTLWLTIAIAVFDYLFLRLAVGLFQRESIVIKWDY
jgi:ABC-2 type transport system permease protein